MSNLREAMKAMVRISGSRTETPSSPTKRSQTAEVSPRRRHVDEIRVDVRLASINGSGSPVGNGLSKQEVVAALRRSQNQRLGQHLAQQQQQPLLPLLASKPAVMEDESTLRSTLLSSPKLLPHLTEAERILIDAGFDEDDVTSPKNSEVERYLVHARQRATKRALHRSLQRVTRSPTHLSSNADKSTTTSGSRIPDFSLTSNSAISSSGAQNSKADRPVPTELLSSDAVSLRTLLNRMQADKNKEAVKRNSKRDIGSHRMAVIPIPASELVKQSASMLGGIDALSLTGVGGNAFRLPSDISAILERTIV